MREFARTLAAGLLLAAFVRPPASTASPVDSCRIATAATLSGCAAENSP